MLTFWTYLMRCTYPWHWIKYSTNYNRCHLIFHSLDKLRCSTMGLARNAFYLNNLLVGSRGATSRCSFVYLRFILHSSVLFHASIWLRTPHTPVGNPIWTHIYVTIRLFIIAPPSISMPLTNPSVSNFNFMQLSQVPNKTISDKSFSHLSRSDGSLPAAHLVAVCDYKSSYRVDASTRLYFAKASH